MSFTLDIIAETQYGNHILFAEVPDQGHGAMVAEALYYHYYDARPSSTPLRYVWLRDMADPQKPRLLEAWPKGEGQQASIAAWNAAPSGVSGSKPINEPTLQKMEAAIYDLLDQLPESYPHPDLTQDQRGYMLKIGHDIIYQAIDVREALERTRRYVKERDRFPDLPVGVIDGIYD
jgi:hypothetical protein